MNIQKDILAKLLATENITVLHEEVRTASFDVKNRTLRLPMWDDMQGYTYDHLVGHEVGHALFTPFEGWHDSVSDRGPAFKSFLNVIEDARIEKLIQRRYPGLRKSFIQSYQKMFAEGFFGGELTEINNYDLIDRVNVLFKCGESYGVRIENEERVWVDEIRNVETWEQVVDIAERMYGMAKEEVEKIAEEQGLKEEIREELEQEDSIDDMSSDSGSPESQEASEEELEQLFGGGEETAEEATEEGDGGQSDDVDSAESEEVTEEMVEEEYNQVIEKMLESKTDDSLRDNMDAAFSDQKVENRWGRTRENVIIPVVNADPYIVGYKELLNISIDEQLASYSYLADGKWVPFAEKYYTNFLSENKKTISYLVKEFEMRKSAAQYSRATVAKTGVIDPVKMNNYMFSEDIFRKTTVLPEGKNHGMIMYLDWSGSMWQDLYNTAIQTLNLVHFCRQVNIPFRVYAFTDHFFGKNVERIQPEMKNGEFCVSKSNYRLLEFFNNKMNKRDFQESSRRLLLLSKKMHEVHGCLRLGGTPLDTTIVLATDIYNKFKKQNRLDIVNTIFLTDGDSHPAEFARISHRDDGSLWDSQIRSNATLVDGVTKKQYKISGNLNNYVPVTPKFLQLYRDRTGGNAIGFRIVSTSKSRFVHELGRTRGYNAVDEIWKDLIKNKYTCMDDAGYSKFFVLRGGKNLKAESGELAVQRGAKKGQLTSAFKKAAKGKITSRALLNEFIAEVA
jgi:hypothetical protein